MKTNFKFAVAAGLLTMSLGAGFAFAALSADDAIKGRKACMKVGHGGVLGVAIPMFKGDKPFDAAALKVAFDAEDKLCADWSMWWAPNLLKGDKEETHAKAEIGTDPKGFDAASTAWYQADQNLRKVTDLEGFKAAFPAVGKGCQGCHEKFRTPLQ